MNSKRRASNTFLSNCENRNQKMFKYDGKAQSRGSELKSRAGKMGCIIQGKAGYKGYTTDYYCNRESNSYNLIVFSCIVESRRCKRTVMDPKCRPDRPDMNDPRPVLAHQSCCQFALGYNCFSFVQQGRIVPSPEQL